MGGIRPETYARWAREADPECPVCHGLGYAYFRAQEKLGEPPNPKFVGGCECLDRKPPTMPDPTPQEVVEARERLKTAASWSSPERCYVQGQTGSEDAATALLAADLRTVLTLLDEAERVLEPFADAALMSEAGGEPPSTFIGAPAIQQAASLLLKLKGPDHG